MTATLDDIARETGYHRTTVSKVLSGNKGCYASERTQRLIKDTAQRLNFVPNYFARSLQTRRSYTVGVAAHLDSTGVTGTMLKAIVDGLRDGGYMVLFCDCSSGPEETKRALRQMQSRRVEGIILNADMNGSATTGMLARGIPVVAIGSDASSPLPCVIADRRQAFANGVQWLADRGHRRIAFMGMDNSVVILNPHNTNSLKITGYRDAMQRLGLYDEELLLDAASSPGAVRDFVAAHGVLFQSITAVLACNDRAAVETMSGLADLGLRVPEDCSIIGFDDTDFAMAVRPRLTTFQPRRAEIGAKAVELVLKLIEGESVESVTVVPQLIERESAK